MKDRNDEEEDKNYPFPRWKLQKIEGSSNGEEKQHQGPLLKSLLEKMSFGRRRNHKLHNGTTILDHSQVRPAICRLPKIFFFLKG